jgi:hypothetical protein
VGERKVLRKNESGRDKTAGREDSTGLDWGKYRREKGRE